MHPTFITGMLAKTSQVTRPDLKELHPKVPSLILVRLLIPHSVSPGPLGLPFMRPAPGCRTFNSTAVEKVVANLTSRMKDPDLARRVKFFLLGSPSQFAIIPDYSKIRTPTHWTRPSNGSTTTSRSLLPAISQRNGCAIRAISSR